MQTTSACTAVSVAIAFLLHAQPAIALCTLGRPSEMLPRDGSIVPRNVQIIVLPSADEGTAGWRIELVRLSTDEVIETTTVRTSPGGALLARAYLEPFSVYDVVMVRRGRSPVRLGQITTNDDVDETAPVWNGLSIVEYDDWHDERHPVPKWPGVVADRSVLHDTAFGVWCAYEGWDPYSAPRAVLPGLHGEIGDGVCSRWNERYWIAPIDAAGNVGRPALLQAEQLVDEAEWQRRRESQEGRFDLTAYAQQPGPYDRFVDAPPAVDVAPPPSLLGTTPRRVIAAALALLVLLVARRAVRLRRATTA
jgi:hypothetical protein